MFKALITVLLWGVRPNPPLGEQPGVKNTDEFVQIRIRSARGVLVTQLTFAFFVCVWVSECSHPIWVAQTCLCGPCIFQLVHHVPGLRTTRLSVTVSGPCAFQLVHHMPVC